MVLPWASTSTSERNRGFPLGYFFSMTLVWGAAEVGVLVAKAAVFVVPAALGAAAAGGRGACANAGLAASIAAAKATSTAKNEYGMDMAIDRLAMGANPISKCTSPVQRGKIAKTGGSR